MYLKEWKGREGRGTKGSRRGRHKQTSHTNPSTQGVIDMDVTASTREMQAGTSISRCPSLPPLVNEKKKKTEREIRMRKERFSVSCLFFVLDLREIH